MAAFFFLGGDYVTGGWFLLGMNILARGVAWISLYHFYVLLVADIFLGFWEVSSLKQGWFSLHVFNQFQPKHTHKPAMYYLVYNPFPLLINRPPIKKTVKQRSAEAPHSGFYSLRCRAAVGLPKRRALSWAFLSFCFVLFLGFPMVSSIFGLCFWRAWSGLL